MVLSLKITFEGAWGRNSHPVAPTVIHVDDDENGQPNDDHVEGHVIGYLRACGIQAKHLRVVTSDLVNGVGAGVVNQRDTTLGRFRMEQLDSARDAA